MQIPLESAVSEINFTSALLLNYHAKNIQQRGIRKNWSSAADAFDTAIQAHILWQSRHLQIMTLPSLCCVHRFC
jgi:hypothetical protein